MSQLEQVFIRGSMIRFLIVPDMLKNAPMFKPRPGARGLAAGAGKSAMMRAQGMDYTHQICRAVLPLFKMVRTHFLFLSYVVHNFNCLLGTFF